MLPGFLCKVCFLFCTFKLWLKTMHSLLSWKIYKCPEGVKSLVPLCELQKYRQELLHLLKWGQYKKIPLKFCLLTLNIILLFGINTQQLLCIDMCINISKDRTLKDLLHTLMYIQETGCTAVSSFSAYCINLSPSLTLCLNHILLWILQCRSGMHE